MSDELRGKRIAVLATDGLEQAELTGPKKHLEVPGASVRVLSIRSTPDELKGWKMADWDDTVRVDAQVSVVEPR
jgi:protease I